MRIGVPTQDGAHVFEGDAQGMGAYELGQRFQIGRAGPDREQIQVCADPAF
jgi:hypothetical protein